MPGSRLRNGLLKEADNTEVDKATTFFLVAISYFQAEHGVDAVADSRFNIPVVVTPFAIFRIVLCGGNALAKLEVKCQFFHGNQRQIDGGFRANVLMLGLFKLHQRPGLKILIEVVANSRCYAN